MMILKTILFLCVMGYVAGNNQKTNSKISCDFEQSNSCFWNNDFNNWMINWKLFDFPGPVRNKAICMASSEEMIEGIAADSAKILTARLWGPVISKKITLGCLSFSYRIYSLPVTNMSKLTLMRREMGSCRSVISKETGFPIVSCESKPLWKSDGKLSQWVLVDVNLNNHNSTDFKLILEGTIPSGNPNAKICVDNITSSAEPCKKPPSPEMLQGNAFSSWVELFAIAFAGALALGLTIPIAVFVVCLFERKRRRGKKNMRIIRHADELDLPEGMNSASCEDTNPLPQRYANTQVGVGHPRLMNRAMSTPAGTNGQGGNYTMGKRNGTPQQAMGPRSNSGQMSHTMGRGGLDSGWMMSSQHGDLMENDEYTIDSDYTTHRQMSVPANGYIPVASQGDTGMMQGQIASMGAIQQTGSQPAMYQNRQIPQPQANVIVSSAATNNPFGNPTNVGMSGTGQDNRSLAGSHVMSFGTDENRATPGLPFYPPRYEEAMGFNHGQQHVPMEEKPPLLPPRVPESSGSGAGTSCSTPLPPAPPPLPLAGHPSANRFNVGGQGMNE